MLGNFNDIRIRNKLWKNCERIFKRLRGKFEKILGAVRIFEKIVRQFQTNFEEIIDQLQNYFINFESERVA